MNQNTLVEEISSLEKELLEKKQLLAALRKKETAKKAVNYVFTSSNGHSVTLSELFKEKDELIIVHNMGKNCSYCTMWADGFNGVYHHIAKKAAFVLSTPDEPHIQDAFAAERRWQFPIVSTSGTVLNKISVLKKTDFIIRVSQPSKKRLMGPFIMFHRLLLDRAMIFVLCGTYLTFSHPDQRPIVHQKK